MLLNQSGANNGGNGSQQWSQSLGSMNNIEKLVYRLCSKVASINNLNNEKSRDDFLNKSYAYMVKLFCSDAYTPVYDTFEVSQKIKKKRKSIFGLLVWSVQSFVGHCNLSSCFDWSSGQPQ